MRSAAYYKAFIEKNFSIVDLHDKTVPFKLNSIQEDILKSLTWNDIILKARRHGISTMVLAIMTVDFLMTENFRAVVVSHETHAAQKLLDKVQFFLESMRKNIPANVDMPLKLKYNSRNELVNEYRNSFFYIGTPGSKSFGRGDQISYLHLSEAASYDDLQKFMTGIIPSVQGGAITIESTANGYNDFRNLWLRNYEKPSPYKDHFIPWFENLEYSCAAPQNEQPSEEEKDLMDRYKININQIVWRRKEIDRLNGDLDKFAQEYPANAEEAFIVSGNNVWSPTLLRWYMNKTKKPVVIGNLYGTQPPRLEENPKGNLRIFKAPNQSHTYVIGADVAEGKNYGDEKQGDFSCAQVIDQMTREQVAVWHGHIDPDLYAMELEMLGMYYNRALIAVERNSIGLTTLTKLRDLYYPNMYYRERFGLNSDRLTDEMGWVTDRSTKNYIVSLGTTLLRDKKVTIYDQETVGEMMGFVRDSNGNAGAASGYHDDRVMSWLIAAKMLDVPQSLSRGNPIEFQKEEPFSPLIGDGGEFSFGDFSGEGLLE